MSSKERLQESLEQLEAGVPVEECLKGLSDKETELLKVVATLRAAPHPKRTPDAINAQRAWLLRQMGPKKGPGTPRTSMNDLMQPIFSWLRKRTVFAGAAAIAALSVCVIIALMAVGVLGPSGRGEERASDSVSQNVLDDASEIHGAQSPSIGLTALSTHQMFIPMIAGPKVRDPVKAVLQDLRGLVEVRANGGAWTAAGAGQLVAAGQRVRTAKLSSAWLAFNDGSWARLGPNTEVVVEELDARTSDGPRVVVLTQSVGETDHYVVSASYGDSRYEVRTPSAVGAAKGTAFHVHVTLDQLTRFSVDEGAVAVTGQEVTVDVVAGQSTSVVADQIPSEPVFRITGEGQVNQIGPTWVIAGQTFETHDDTVIIGNPQVGDWVFIEGHLLTDGTCIADWIALRRRSPENHFTIIGHVDSIEEDEWVVDSQSIVVDEATDVDEGIEEGHLVQVEGTILAGGVLQAEEIRLIEGMPGLPFYFIGVVGDITDETWTISGITISVGEETEIEEELAVGDMVEVRGWILEGEQWLASVIESVEAEEHTFEFTGIVDSIDPWIVSGISFETSEWTEIDLGIQVGHRVKVEGRILEDGTWVASEIKWLDDDLVLQLVFVGTVDDTDPWVISGIPLAVNDETVIEGDISSGDLVKVTVSVMPDGEWLANRIELLELGEESQGCVYVTAVVENVGPGWVELLNWSAVDLEDVPVEGDLQVGSVVLMLVCVDANGAVTVQSIVVIYQPEPVIPPAPWPPSDAGDEEGEKMTICHKPNSKNPLTITISRSALQAHLNHGDSIGPCE